MTAKQGEGRCPHPLKERRPAGPGKVKCRKCSRVFRPRGARVTHGTYQGYSRHLRERAGKWMFPIEGDCGCAEAATAWRREYTRRPEALQAVRVRGLARAEALARLRRIHPGMYAQFYREEIEKRGGAEIRQHHSIPSWEDLLGRLVKASLERDLDSMNERIAHGWATARELEVMRLITRLRVLLANGGRV